MFMLTEAEFVGLRSHFVTSSGWGARRRPLPSDTSIPMYFRFHRQNDCSLTPICRQTSPTYIPDSSCPRAYLICPSLNRAFRIVVLLREDRF